MEQVPPHNLDAEQSVLAAIILDNDALVKVMEMLQPEDFYVGSHRILFTAMREMSEKGAPLDLITLTEQLQATGRLEQAGGPAAISDLTGRVSTAANVEYWARIVRDKSLLRKMISRSTEIITEAYQEPEQMEVFLDRAENKILEVASHQTRTSYQPLSEIIQESFKIIEDFENRKGAVTGVPSGFNDLDKLTSGFQRNELAILAGRPSTGKTALALNFIRNAALDAELTVAFFSLEMAATQLVMRMICSEARMNFERLRRGEFKKNHWITLTNAASALSQSKIYIEDTAVLSVLGLKAKARRIKAEYGLDIVIVDYLQLLQGLGTKKSRDSREQEIAEISRSLKGMAKELDIPVLALSQLSRAVERREDKTPILSDLRESGSLEQDADLILFLHRPGMYKRKSKDKSGYNPYAEEEVHDSEEDDKLTELIIGKQRNGPTGIINLTFLKEYTRFEPYEGRYDESMMPDSS